MFISEIVRISPSKNEGMAVHVAVLDSSGQAYTIQLSTDASIALKSGLPEFIGEEPEFSGQDEE